MKEMDRVIDTVHKYGMKIVPYFQPGTLHPDVPAYAQYHEDWKWTTGEKGTENIDRYGARMCLESGYRDFVKNHIKTVLTNHRFDGAYFDGAGYNYCQNKEHLDGRDHLNVDGWIDLMEWTRDFVGSEGIIIAHPSANLPSLTLENLADAIVTFEEQAQEYKIPTLEAFSPHAVFVNLMPRLIDVAVATFQKKEQKDIALKNIVSKCIVLGLFIYGGNWDGDEAALELFRRFRSYDLGQFGFKDYTHSPVEVSKEDIKTATYWNEDTILVILSNVSPQHVKNFNWCIDLKHLEWESMGELSLIDNRGDNIQIRKAEEIKKTGVNESLEGYEYKIYAIKRHNNKKGYILYNTRTWAEEFHDNKLTVVTSGPLGQQAILKFYFPEKPEVVNKGNESLINSPKWSWDEGKKIGTIHYIYDERKPITFKIAEK
ncbi:hypothetical protein KKC91_00145 [bacterium]|nr:hypothetical protein [bacterium]